MKDKPRLGIVKLLNDLADLRCALRDAGVPDVAAHRIAVQYGIDRIKVLRREARPPEPEMGWRDGRWTRIDDGDGPGYD